MMRGPTEMGSRRRKARPRRLVAWVGGACVAAMTVGTGCQLIGGIDDIELALDGSVPDGHVADASSLLDAGRDGDAVSGEASVVATACFQTSGPATTCYPTGACDIDAGGCCADGTFTTCGAAGSACCPGNPYDSGESPDFCNAVGSVAQLICGDGGTCVTCEAMGQGPAGASCCPFESPGNLGNDGCEFGACCDPGTAQCVAAGATCSGGTSCSGFAANNCGCGLVDEPCCGNHVCGPALACVGTTCVHCGAAGEPCCPGAACAAGACDPTSNKCATSVACSGSCGAVGGACCAGGSCAATSCCDADAGACIEAGAVCSTGYACLGGSCACGAVGTACCTSGRACTTTGCCDTTTGACVANATACGTSKVCASGSCVACGGHLQPCCAGDVCGVDAGTCDNGSCR